MLLLVEHLLMLTTRGVFTYLRFGEDLRGQRFVQLRNHLNLLRYDFLSQEWSVCCVEAVIRRNIWVWVNWFQELIFQNLTIWGQSVPCHIIVVLVLFVASERPLRHVL